METKPRYLREQPELLATKNVKKLAAAIFCRIVQVRRRRLAKRGTKMAKTPPAASFGRTASALRKELAAKRARKRAAVSTGRTHLRRR